MSSGTQIDRAITHRCKKFEEEQKKVAGEENQEIDGGVMEDLVEKARRTVNTGMTSIVTFRGKYDDKQGQGVFNEEEIGCWGMGGGQRKERTVGQRKHDIGHIITFLLLDDAETVLIKREVRSCRRFRILGWPQRFASKDREGTIPGCNANRIEPAIPRAACAKEIKDRQETIQRFFPVTAYTLGMC